MYVRAYGRRCKDHVTFFFSFCVYVCIKNNKNTVKKKKKLSGEKREKIK